MKTDDLIAALAREPVAVAPPLSRSALSGLALGLPLALLLMAASIGIRADIGEVLVDPWFLTKLALAGAASFAGYRAALAALTPGAGLVMRWVVAFVALVGTAIGADLLVHGLEDAAARMEGDNGLKCLVLVPAFSVLPLAVLIWCLRDGAPVSPGRAGALVGLLAGGVGSFAYGLHCTDDSPLFFALWYLAAIALVAGAGALIGARALRW
jgi:hypothetical protein